MREALVAVVGLLLGRPKPTSEEVCGASGEHPRVAKVPPPRPQADRPRPPHHTPGANAAAKARVDMDATPPRPSAAVPGRAAVVPQPSRELAALRSYLRSDRPPVGLRVGVWPRNELDVLAELAELTAELNDPLAAANAMFGGGQ